MKSYRLERQQWIPQPLPVVFDFFSRAENLERITPPWLHFRIRTPTPLSMGVGARIVYTIRIAGVPIRWRTCITRWEPEVGFVDEQERGPYARWEHHHEFAIAGDGVLMTDRVLYALPFGPIGRATHTLAVRASLAAIFDHRFDRIRVLLSDDIQGEADV